LWRPLVGLGQNPRTPGSPMLDSSGFGSGSGLRLGVLRHHERSRVPDFFDAMEYSTFDAFVDDLIRLPLLFTVQIC
ncbi:hypothetical protein U1Q18_027859, partial [Sarracenia purpurea var. burkii]